tara:strand:- start:1623 stop:1883 length:261 start_codon:yes stop_codon:yes gene_type:complete
MILNIPTVLIVILMLIGIAYFSYSLIYLTKTINSYLVYKQPLYTSKDKEIFLLKEKISELQKKNSFLESQIQEITQNMITQLQEKM